MSIEAAKKYLESKTGDTYIAPEQGRLDPSAMKKMIETLCALLYYPMDMTGRRSPMFNASLVDKRVRPSAYIPFSSLGFSEEELLMLLETYERVRDGGTRREIIQEDM